MLKRVADISLGILFSCASLLAQNQGTRKISSENTKSYQNVPVSTINLNIEAGKVWIKGNLIPKKELPQSLQEIDPSIQFSSAAFGVGEIRFNLNGYEYLVKEDQIMELSSSTLETPPLGNRSSKGAMEEYYSNLKRESPNLFYSLGREAALTERARNLVYEFQVKDSGDKQNIRKELTVVLGQLFEINEHNRQKEIIELRQMIDAAQQEIQYRKANKQLIIDNTVKELIGE